MTKVIDGGVLMQTFIQTITKGRVGILWVILTMLIATSTSSWFSWLWSAEMTPKVHPCIEPISHVYDVNTTLVAWENYLIREKIVIDGMAKRTIKGFVSFMHEAYSPCLKDQMDKIWDRPSDWKTYLKRIIGSEAFLYSSPGTLALIVLLVQCMQNRCCKKGDYKLLRKRQARSHLMR